MSSITEKAINKFNNGENFKLSNTEVSVEKREVFLKLHGNIIASWLSGYLFITTSGYNTRVTRRRLNGFPQIHVQQIKGELHLNGCKWDGNFTNVGKYSI